VTICMGALCTDRLAGDTPATWALSARDALAAAKIIAEAAAKVANVPRPVHEIADVVAQQYHSVRMNAAETQILLPRGLTLATYYDRHQQLLSQIAVDLDQSLASFDPEVELIVAGVDSSGGTCSP